MSTRRAILVFAKSPKPGKVKTRLHAAIAPEQAAAIHAACIEDTLSLLKAVRDCEVFLFVAGGTSYFRRLLENKPAVSRLRVLPQHGSDLGERLENAFKKCFRLSCRQLVVIGTDTPWMGAERIRQAFAALNEHDVVIGPAEDGGYYLLGMRSMNPELFRQISWSTGCVFAQTLSAAKRNKLSVKRLRRDFDLDRPKDLRRLQKKLKRNPKLAPALADALGNLTYLIHPPAITRSPS